MLLWLDYFDHLILCIHSQSSKLLYFFLGSNISLPPFFLQHVQNQAIRILTWSNRRSHVTDLYRELHILNIDNLIKFNVCTFAYQAVKDPSLLKFVLIQHLTNSNITRFSSNNNFILPKVRTNYGSQRVAFVLIKLWNSLPYNIKCAFSISSFKHQLRNFMFNL